MMSASTNGGGQCALPGPLDVCKMPPFGVPAPLPNFAAPAQASGGTCSGKVLILNKKTCVKGTKISMSSGDEPGVMGGVVSGGIKGPCTYKAGSSKVRAEGKGVAHLCAQTAHNGSNANAPAGLQVAPSQSKVSVMP